MIRHSILSLSIALVATLAVSRAQAVTDDLSSTSPSIEDDVNAPPDPTPGLQANEPFEGSGEPVAIDPNAPAGPPQDKVQPEPLPFVQPFMAPKNFTPQMACTNALRQAANRIHSRGVIVSRDGQSITIEGAAASSARKGPFGKGQPNLRVYTKSGATSIDGLRCDHDRDVTLGAGALRLLRILASEEKDRPRPRCGGGGNIKPTGEAMSSNEAIARCAIPMSEAVAADDVQSNGPHKIKIPPPQAGDLVGRVLKACSDVYPELAQFNDHSSEPSHPGHKPLPYDVSKVKPAAN